MRLGLGVLRLPPAHFWSMTPAELLAAIGPATDASSAPTLRRGDLLRLMTDFPDRRPLSAGDPHGDR